MTKRNDANVPQERGNNDQITAMQKKWGVSANEIRNAIAQVGYDRPKIEEYLVNNRWSKK